MDTRQSLLGLAAGCLFLTAPANAQTVFDDVLPQTSRWSQTATYDIADCGANAIAAVATHVNADNRLDLVVVHPICGISALLGRQGGGFDEVVHTPALGYYAAVSALVIEDLNHDGFVDVVLPQNTWDEVHVYLGRGDGNFWPPEIHSVGELPLGVQSGDFNEDGHLDLVVPERSGRTAILLGRGNGDFDPPVMWDGEGQDVAIGDFDGDGHLDYVVDPIFSFRAEQIAVVFGRGDGTFDPMHLVDLGGFTPQILAEDLDFDGRTDLLVLPQPQDYVSPAQAWVLRAMPGRQFAPPTVVDADWEGGRPWLADANGDGLHDLFHRVGGQLVVRWGNGDGTFRPPIGTGARAWVTSLADMNEDGMADLVGSTRVIGTLTGRRAVVHYQIEPGVPPGSIVPAIRRGANRAPRTRGR